jgi:hypothetical protein
MALWRIACWGALGGFLVELAALFTLLVGWRNRERDAAQVRAEGGTPAPNPLPFAWRLDLLVLASRCVLGAAGAIALIHTGITQASPQGALLTGIAAPAALTQLSRSQTLQERLLGMDPVGAGPDATLSAATLVAAVPEPSPNLLAATQTPLEAEPPDAGNSGTLHLASGQSGIAYQSEANDGT